MRRCQTSFLLRLCVPRLQKRCGAPQRRLSALLLSRFLPGEIP